MTSPKALRLLLMAWASFRHSPVLPDFFTLQQRMAMTLMWVVTVQEGV